MFDRIREKFEALRRLDASRQVFAADRHKYKLNPPLSATKVKAIEGRLGVELPEQYRRFVSEFADGGAGPDNGIHSLSAWMRRPIDPGLAESLRRPFPAPRTLNAMRSLDSSPDGAFDVCEIGCGGNYWLVVTGADRGRVWVQNPDMEWTPELSDESHVPEYTDDRSINKILIACLRSPDELKLQFADWYEKWLDDSLRKLKAKSGRARKQ